MINSFRKEHTKITKLLDQLKTLGIHSEEGKKELLSLRDLMVTHMQNEDQNLYPKLRNAAKQNHHLEDILNEFDADMSKITHYTLGFFDGYIASYSNKSMIELETFIETLRRRILREDNILFKEYEKLYKENQNI